MNEHIHLGSWTAVDVTRLIEEASGLSEPGMKLEFLSKHFLGTPYTESTLVGGMDTPEEFVVNLQAFDCFTFIEYMEAMRRAVSFEDFKACLQSVRYRHGLVAFKNRNHFFTDWKAFNAGFVVDVTKAISGSGCQDVTKRLNEKNDGTHFLPGVDCRLREISYLPAASLTDDVLSQLNTGDYIGIYSKQDGLDVSHCGIFIRKGKEAFLRHASSVKKHRKVMDEGLMEYMKSKPGIIVFRPTNE